MKIPLLLFPALLAISCAANAQVAPAVSPPISPTAPSTPALTSANSKSWLASRGTLSVDEIGALIGADFSPAQRAQLQEAVAARNAALERANAQLATQLGQILGQGDAQIGARIESKTLRDAEDERMERLKRLQPSRYRELLRRKKASERK